MNYDFFLEKNHYKRVRKKLKTFPLENVVSKYCKVKNLPGISRSTNTKNSPNNDPLTDDMTISSVRLLALNSTNVGSKRYT